MKNETANSNHIQDAAKAHVFNLIIVDESGSMGHLRQTTLSGVNETIDTMEVSGTVLSAENLEPVKGILVGLYAADSTFHDSLFTTHPLIRVARTNGSGQFTIKGVKQGQYRAYALQDMDGNYRFSQKSEVLAFDTTTLSTRQRPDIRPDTIWTIDSLVEKIRMVPFIHYYPDNVVLRSFLEEGQDKHLLKTERKTPDSFTLYFTAPQDSLPQIEGFGFDASKVLLPEPSLHNDTITYWITDTLVSYPDTLTLSLSYFDTDTLGMDQWKTDTLELVARSTHAKLEKERKRKSEEWKKDREKKMKKLKGNLPPEENPFEVTYMTNQIQPGTSIAPNQNITFTFSEPIQKVDMEHIHFYTKVDTNFVEEPFLLRPVEGEVRKYRLYAEWEPNKKYQFRADSLAFLGVLGHYGQSIKSDIRIRSLDEFGAIFIRLVGIEPNGQPHRTAPEQKRQARGPDGGRQEGTRRLLLPETGGLLHAPHRRPQQQRQMGHRGIPKHDSPGRGLLLSAHHSAESQVRNGTGLELPQHRHDPAEAQGHHEAKG